MTKVLSREFIKKVIQGERDFSDCDFSSNRLSSSIGFDELNEYLKNSDLAKNPLLFNYAHMIHLKAQNVWMPYSDFGVADMESSDFSGANLQGAKLENAYLEGTRFNDTTLSNTCLDPNATPNQRALGRFRRDGEFIVGYRTKHSPYMPGKGYNAGETYEAPVLSVADRSCHPGLYLFPTVRSVRGFRPIKEPVVKVWAKPEETHRAGNKWRCRKFYKVEDL